MTGSAQSTGSVYTPDFLVTGIFMATTTLTVFLTNYGYATLLTLGTLTAVNFALACFVMTLNLKE